MPDRLPSLIVLVGFWGPPAIAGWMMAGAAYRSRVTGRTRTAVAGLATFVACYAFAWFAFNAVRMPPYIPGAVPTDPTIATPGAVAALAMFTSVVILPGSALACALAYRYRSRVLRGAT